MASVELQAVIDQLRAHPIDPNVPLEVLRAAFPAVPAPEGTTVTPIDAGGIPAEWVVADAAAPDRRRTELRAASLAGRGGTRPRWPPRSRRWPTVRGEES